jgi:hypothetical protein
VETDAGHCADRPQPTKRFAGLTDRWLIVLHAAFLPQSV